MQTRLDIGRFHCGFEAGIFIAGTTHWGFQCYRTKSYLWPSWTRTKHIGMRMLGVRWMLNLGQLSEGVLLGRRDDARLRARFYSATERDVWPDVIADIDATPATARNTSLP